MEQYVDWFNVMTYDIHGTWDGDNPNTAAVVNPHTNLTGICFHFSMFPRNHTPPCSGNDACFYSANHLPPPPVDFVRTKLTGV